MTGDDGKPTTDDCQKKAAELGFDLTKQFLTLAFAGIAFIVGLSFNTPGSVSSIMFWAVIITFGLSAILGLFFLMHGVNLLSVQKSFDIYASSLRFLAGLQVILMLIGTALLIPILGARQQARKTAQGNPSIEIRVSPQQIVTYPIDPNKNFVIELENGKLKISNTADGTSHP
jgi:hypothetical protein